MREELNSQTLKCEVAEDELPQWARPQICFIQITLTEAADISEDDGLAGFS